MAWAHKLILASILALAACAPAMQGEAGIAASGPAADGEALVRARCATCHAVGPAGASPMAEAPALRDLHRRYPVAYLQEALAEGLMTAHPAMPQVELAPEQITALIAYLESLESD